ncbi:MAG: cytochrome c oxidase assembly factor Coa1 family protein [Pirellulaceae bacterium]
MDVPEKESKSSPKKKGGLLRLIGVGLIGLLIMGVAGGIGIWIKNRADKQRNLEDNILQELKQPQKLAFDAIADDSGAKEALGDEIKDAGGFARDGSGELDRTAVVLHFDVTGSKGKGRVRAPAAHQEGAWQITGEIELKLANGKTIKVARPADKPPEIEF